MSVASALLLGSLLEQSNRTFPGMCRCSSGYVHVYLMRSVAAWWQLHLLLYLPQQTVRGGRLATKVAVGCLCTYVPVKLWCVVYMAIVWCHHTVFVAAELGSVQGRVYVCDAGGCSIVLEAAALVGHYFLQGWAGLRGLFASAACS